MSKLTIQEAIDRFLAEAEYQIDRYPTNMPLWVFNCYQDFVEATTEVTLDLEDWEQLDED